MTSRFSLEEMKEYVQQYIILWAKKRDEGACVGEQCYVKLFFLIICKYSQTQLERACLGPGNFVRYSHNLL